MNNFIELYFIVDDTDSTWGFFETEEEAKIELKDTEESFKIKKGKITIQQILEIFSEFDVYVYGYINPEFEE